MKIFNKYVFLIMTITSLLNVFLLIIRDSVSISILTGDILDFTKIGYLIIAVMAGRDKNYKTFYLIGAILFLLIFEFLLGYFINSVLSFDNTYFILTLKSVAIGICYSYFYEAFRRMSYKHVEEFNKEHNINYNKKDFKL